MFYPLEQKSRKRKLLLEQTLPSEQCDTLKIWKDEKIGNLPCSIYSQELVGGASLPTSLESKQLNSLKLTQMPNLSSNLISHPSLSIPTSETITLEEENLTSSGTHSLAQILPSQGTRQESTENIASCGLKLSESSENAIQHSSLSKIQQDCSIEAWERCYKGFPKAGMMRNGILFPQPHLERHIGENGFLSLPTPTASSGTDNSRPAGVTKCEKWFKDNGLLQSSQCLSAQMMALLQGFPMDWTQCLSELTEDLRDESEADTCSAEQLCLDVLRSLSNESSISIPASSDKLKIPTGIGRKSLPPERTKKIPLERSSSPLEQKAEDERGIELCDRLAELESKRNSICATGPIAPAGVWIEHGKVSKRSFKQAYYRSEKPIFQPKRQNSLAKSESGLVKRCYIGEENSKEVKAAADAIARRKELERIGREIELIERRLCE